MAEKMLQERLTQWFGRTPTERSINVPGEVPVSIATDRGLTRDDNQDRAAIMRVSPGGTSKPFIVLALSDGMGGMKDGERCAAITLATFLSEMIKRRGSHPAARLDESIRAADAAVFQFAQSHGGATLSAVLITETSSFLANVGDSRIYSTTEKPASAELVRLTVDDSLEDAFGGHGRALLQFVGMGQSIQPHVTQVPEPTRRLILTSDGIHFVQQDVLASIILNAKDNRQMADRLSALARWCGSPDNATLISAHLDELRESLSYSNEPGIEIWDPQEALHVMWLRSDAISDMPPPLPQEFPSAGALALSEPDHPPPKKPRKSRQKRKKPIEQNKLPQLKIDHDDTFSVSEGMDDRG